MADTYHLIVTEPFAGRVRGERITDEAEVHDILTGESTAHVVRVAVPVTPAVAAPFFPEQGA